MIHTRTLRCPSSYPAGRLIRHSLISFLFLFVSLPFVSAQAKDAALKSFAIEAGEASATLKQFAAQSGVQLLYTPEDVAGVRTSAVKGSFAPVAAIEVMLAGTKLAAVQDKTSAAIAIKRQSDPNVGRAALAETPSDRPATKTKTNDEDTIVLDKFVVSGTSLSLRRAIADKRGEAVVVDTISADEIGSIPDFGLGEALERLPGVSMIINNGRGESQFATLRGLNSDYNAVFIDGMQLPSTETSRRNVSLDVIPSALAKGIRNFKTFTPEMGGDAIGGVVDLRTRSAFDNAGYFVSARANYGIYENTRYTADRTPSGQAEIAFSNTFGSRKQHGIVVSASYFRRDSNTMLPSATAYYFYDANGNKLANNSPDLATATLVPDRRRWLSYDNLRERNGLFAKYEFHGRDALSAHVTAGYFQHLNDEERQSNILIQNSGTAGKPKIASPTSGYVGSGNAQTDLAQYYQDRRIYYGEAGLNFRPTSTDEVEFTVHYASGLYRQDATFDTYRAGNTTSLAYFYENVDGSIPVFTPVNWDYYYNPANYRQYEHGWAMNNNREDILTVKLDYGRNMNPDSKGWGFKTGAKFRYLDRCYDYWQLNFRPTSSTLTMADALDPRRIYPYNGRGTYLLLVDPDKAQAVFEANPSLYPLLAATELNNLQSDFLLTESVTGGYLMATYRGNRFSGIAGMRYESTDLETTSTTTQTEGKITKYIPETQSSNYDTWMPSINLTYNLTRNMCLRAAVSRSISRPNYDYLAARTVLKDNDAGYITISKGNPELKPRESENFDLSYEWYFSKDSMFSTAVFRKNVANEIIKLSSSTTSVIDGLNTTTVTTTPRNLDAARIDGFEIGFVDTRFDFLPGPLANFGLQTNLTILSMDASQIQMADGTLRKLPNLLESPKSTFNATLLFNLKKFSAQVSYKRTGKMMVAIDTDTAFDDRYYRENNIWDAQLRYRWSTNISFTLQAKNFTNNRPTRVMGFSQEWAAEEIDNGRAWFIGATYTFK